jgi:hypothetical protein
MRLQLLSSLALVLLGSLTACRAQDSAPSALETLPDCAVRKIDILRVLCGPKPSLLTP